MGPWPTKEIKNRIPDCCTKELGFEVMEQLKNTKALFDFHLWLVLAGPGKNSNFYNLVIYNFNYTIL